MLTDMQIPVMLGSDKATQHLLAPVQETLVAVQNYSIGDIFIFNNGLYKVTDNITSGSNIVIGSGAGCNADVSTQTIYEETRNELKSTNIWTEAVANAKNYILAIVNVTATGVSGTYSFQCIVPKATIENGGAKYFLSGAYHNSNQWYCTFYVSSSSASADVYHNSNGSGITKTYEFYYN